MKRSCRRTAEENRIHEQAVKIRKMTDDQLLRYINAREQKAREEVSRDNQAAQQTNSVKDFLDLISKQKVPGIGIVTVNKLLKVANDNGII